MTHYFGRIWSRAIILFIAINILLFGDGNASDWILKSNFSLEEIPSEVIPAKDGKHLYLLIPGKILIFSLLENRIVDFMPVDRKFDHLSVSGRERLFFLSSSKDKTVSIFELQKTFNLAGLPYKGPPDAPVTVAVFSDYQ